MDRQSCSYQFQNRQIRSSPPSNQSNTVQCRENKESTRWALSVLSAQLLEWWGWPIVHFNYHPAAGTLVWTVISAHISSVGGMVMPVRPCLQTPWKSERKTKWKCMFSKHVSGYNASPSFLRAPPPFLKPFAAFRHSNMIFLLIIIGLLFLECMIAREQHMHLGVLQGACWRFFHCAVGFKCEREILLEHITLSGRIPRAKTKPTLEQRVESERENETKERL